MTLREFIEEISRTKDELLDKEIVIKAENGLLLEPRIKFMAKDIGNLKLDAEHIDKVIVCWD